MSETGGVNSAMLESMNQHSKPDVYSSQAIANNEGSILGGSLDGVVSTDQIHLFEGGDLSKSGIMGRIKGFMSESITKVIDSVSETMGYVQGVGKHMSDMTMQPYGGHNFRAPNVATESQFKNEVGAPAFDENQAQH